MPDIRARQRKLSLRADTESMTETSATGYAAMHLPPGKRTEEILGMIRMGLPFMENHCGRRPGYLHNYLLVLSRKIKSLTFDALLQELAFEARRRELLGEHVSPIEKIDREFELLTYHDPKHGRVQLTFDTLRGKLTKIKKVLGSDSQFPLNHESWWVGSP